MFGYLTIDALSGKADRDNAPIANVNDGEVNQNVNHRDNDNHNVRFRPAVEYYNVMQKAIFSAGCPALCKQVRD